MPRVYARRHEYAAVDTFGRMHRILADKGYKDKDIAEAIGVSPASFSRTRRNGELKMSQAFNLIELCEITDEELVYILRGRTKHEKSNGNGGNGRIITHPAAVRNRRSG